MRNFTTIESLRGWMAWWVVVGHALHLMGAGPGGGSGPLDNIPRPLFSFLVSGDTGVRVFIIISGFVITHLLIGKQESYQNYLLRRFLRLAPIYLFCVLIALLITDLYRLAYVDNPLPVGREMRIERFGQEQENFWTHLLLHLTLLHSVVPDTLLPYASTAFLAPAWSLSLEWQFYLIAPMLIAVVLRSGMAAFWLAVALVAIKFGLHHSSLHWQYEGFFFLAGDLFMIGILSRMAVERIRQGGSGVGYMLLIVVLLLQVDIKAALIWTFFFALTLCEIGFIPVRSKSVAWLHRILALNPVMSSLGRWSYSTYLIHIPLFSILVGAYVGYVGTDKVSQLMVAIILVASMPLLVLISALLYNFIEKPPIGLGKRIIAKQGQKTSGSQIVQ
ncbi:acyltransferase [Sinirhodobacter populi]|uniref:Acyltransferase n=1 Tax=Paenirhodobacter populi TaxID=2306993 RepID=A0A443JZW0_9RHOB|nr:acyltransferase [Sinirhodobacter populi]RWR26057.1 acyltransferase [Sinirhodobacter populi]